MNWMALEEEIRSSFTTCKLTVPEGRILMPREVISLHDALSKYTLSEEGEQQIYDEGVEGLIGDRWSLRNILDFEWDGLGPITWYLGLHTFEIGTGREYVCMWGEEERGGPTAVAALEPTGDTALFQAFLKDLLADNGESYRYPLFNSLPTMTRNRRPDLLPTSVVRDAYTNWMRWSQLHGSQNWSGLLTYLRHVAKEPDHLKRVLAITKEMGSGRPPEDRPDQVHRWKADREKDRNRPYFQWEWEAILELYFKLSYEVRPYKPSGL